MIMCMLNNPFNNVVKIHLSGVKINEQYFKPY